MDVHLAMPLARLRFFLLLILAFAAVHADFRPAEDLPDTWENIHPALTFNSHVSNLSAEAGKIDVVWGSSHPYQPPGVYNMYYYPFEREYTTSNFTFWNSTHPDWIEYQCDRVTPAYTFGDTNMPLDIANPAVLDYMFTTYLSPAIWRGYEGIAFDNVALYSYGKRCGHYNLSGSWVAQYSGNNTDPAYMADVMLWAANMTERIHAINGTATMNFEFLYASGAENTLSYQLLGLMDMQFDERGMTNWGHSGDNYMTDDLWMQVMQEYQYMAEHDKGLVICNEEPENFSAISREEVQWILANYLLAKGNHTYIYITGPPG
ncbi:MAG: hypothetical protein PHS02_02830, partial [Candidatus ainarchaeum sp.]|nr:hypothetical protein [Candidatus ainarchaeum sp.]